MALLILLLGVVSIKTTPTDIFPEIDIPVVTVVWQNSGLSPDQMDAQHVIRYRPVILGRYLGEKIEILSGLDAGDSLVANPSEGVEVKVQTPPAAKL
jgi:hypothetical protein